MALRDWMPLRRRDLRQATDDLWRYVDQLAHRITTLGARMSTFEQQIALLDQVTNDIADRVEARDQLIAQLREAIAANDLERAAALAAQDEQHAAILDTAVAKLRGIGADPDNPVPDPEPLPLPPPSDDGTVA